MIEPNHKEQGIGIVIPIYNESLILEESLLRLVNELEKESFNFKILLCENGSTDGTQDIAKKLSDKYSQISFFSYPSPNYGAALKKGIGDIGMKKVLCLEIDYLNIEFIKEASFLLDKYDIVIGSKALKSSDDRRSLLRRMLTWGMNFSLRLLFGFSGSDTHGIKALNMEKVSFILKKCVTDKDIFASELVIRAEKAGLKIKEIPISIDDIRPPRVSILRRFPNVLLNLLRLFLQINILNR